MSEVKTRNALYAMSVLGCAWVVCVFGCAWIVNVLKACHAHIGTHKGRLQRCVATHEVAWGWGGAEDGCGMGSVNADVDHPGFEPLPITVAASETHKHGTAV